MSIFSKIYGGSWSVKSSENLIKVEPSIKSGVVVEGTYGKQVCFLLTTGGKGYLPLSSQSTLNVGDEFPVAGATVITLSKEGEADIMRVQE